MDSFVVSVGNPIYHPPATQPELVLVDFWDGRAVFLRKTDPNEPIEDLIAQAKHMRKLRILTNRREKERN